MDSYHDVMRLKRNCLKPPLQASKPVWERIRELFGMEVVVGNAVPVISLDSLYDSWNSGMDR